MLPFSAAERRQNVATAEGRGFRLGKTKPRQGRKIFQARQSFAPDGAMSGCECKRDSAQPPKNWVSATNAFHGLQPWLRFCAAPRLKTEAFLRRACECLARCLCQHRDFARFH